jgi:hypothetical protein
VGGGNVVGHGDVHGPGVFGASRFQVLIRRILDLYGVLVILGLGGTRWRSGEHSVVFEVLSNVNKKKLSMLFKEREEKKEEKEERCLEGWKKDSEGKNTGILLTRMKKQVTRFS